MKHIERLFAIGLFCTSLAPEVLAQTAEERAGARAAAEQGVKAFADGRWAEAADLMGRAEKLVHAPTHLLYQAQAEEKLGHLVVAHELYLKIVREKLAPGSPEVFLSAQKEAQSRADALRPKLSQVSIVVQGSPAGTAVHVTMDDHRVPDALVGVPHPIDPGEHRFEATAEGMRSSLAKVVLREGASETVVLTLQGDPASAKPTAAPAPALMDGTTAAPGQPAAAPTQPASATADASTSSSGMHPLKIGGFVGLGVGVVGLGVGTIFAIRSNSFRSDADALCSPNGTCPTANRPRIDELDSDADSAKTIAIVGFVAGGVGVAAGVTMLLLAPPKEPPKTAFVAPYFTGNSAGIWGRF
jgi:hypothetical protein